MTTPPPSTNVLVLVQEPEPNGLTDAPPGPSGVVSGACLSYLATIVGDVNAAVEAWAAEYFIAGTTVTVITGAEIVATHVVSATST